MTSRIYTRTGDGGETGLFGGGRVSKSHPRVEAYGEIDELNAFLGHAATMVRDSSVLDHIGILQADLFTLGAHLATPPAVGSRTPAELPQLPLDRVVQIEGWIDQAEIRLDPLKSFILPGGSAGAAALHICRTVCRRAERRVVALAAESEVDPFICVLLNRISDYLFVAARAENHGAGRADIRWDPVGRSKGS